mmetsp:Transcript_105025/g.306889  ORF Transcript_105025/g.306889 Transcript_105025/m.306889 type:complete len:98 (-) Transcript_105025:1-294(-)
MGRAAIAAKEWGLRLGFLFYSHIEYFVSPCLEEREGAIPFFFAIRPCLITLCNAITGNLTTRASQWCAGNGLRHKECHCHNNHPAHSACARLQGHAP